MTEQMIDRDDPEQFMEWMDLLSTPRVLSEPQIARLMALHAAFSDREDPTADITGHLNS